MVATAHPPLPRLSPRDREQSQHHKCKKRSHRRHAWLWHAHSPSRDQISVATSWQLGCIRLGQNC